ncbi:MAG: outer membrane protein assembly factor BamE [Acidiferrobacterales bacterium]
MSKSIIRVMGLLLIAWLGGTCGIVYRPDVQQGNVVTQEMIDQLEIGMTRRQVRFILGTPLIEDPFHAERWDYYYLFKTRKGRNEQRLLQVIFDGDRLVEIRGDVEIKGKGTTSAESSDQESQLEQDNGPSNMNLLAMS